MSFTSTVKNEISKLEISDAEMISELSAIINTSAMIMGNTIKIDTENSSIARRIYTNLKNIYKVNPKITVRKGYNFHKNYIYIIEIKKKNILENLGISSNIPSDFIVADEELTSAYLRGVFMVAGSINDPKKSRYHLEFLVDDEKYANFIMNLLNNFDLNSKVIKKGNKFMIYIKEAEKIGDFLRVIKAISSLLYYEDIRIYRDHKNMTNRLNNCEQANVDKVVESAISQVKDIKIIRDNDAFDLLDDKLKTVAIYREKYEETSLQELADIITVETGIKITKSGIYHRMNKIRDFANKFKNI